MQLNKFDCKFIRMAIKSFALVIVIFIIMIGIEIPILIAKIAAQFMMGVCLLVQRFYWNYLQGLELKEEIEGITG